VRDYAAQKELEEGEALNAGMKEKAREFIAAGAQVYQGKLPEGVELEH